MSTHIKRMVIAPMLLDGNVREDLKIEVTEGDFFRILTDFCDRNKERLAWITIVDENDGKFCFLKKTDGKIWDGSNEVVFLEDMDFKRNAWQNDK